MTLVVTVVGSGHKRLAEAVRALGEGKARGAYARAINHTGNKAATAAAKAIPGQTGLSATVGRKAVRRRIRANAGNLQFEIPVSGGDIRLKYFKARETRKGVSAAPWNSRQVYAGTFMRAGWWPRRVKKPAWNGQVFRRAGDGFAVVKSGLYLPTEVVEGQIASAFESKAADLQPRAEHEIRRVTKGAVS
jgi:hypothetical protein